MVNQVGITFFYIQGFLGNSSLIKTLKSMISLSFSLFLIIADGKNWFSKEVRRKMSTSDFW